MRSLDSARDACETSHPSLLKALTAIPLSERETPGSPVIDVFRAYDGPALLAPAEFGGVGASPLVAARVMRAIAACSPSLDRKSVV